MTSFGALVGNNPENRTFREDATWVLPRCMIGIELEFENFDISQINFSNEYPLWEVVHDHSLRGNHAHELVLSEPMFGADLKEAIDSIYSAIAEGRLPKPEHSPRTSTHVHIDIRDLTYEQLRMLGSLATFVEPLLLHYCSEDRHNNIYCPPAYKSTPAQRALGNMYNANDVGDEEQAARILHSRAEDFCKYTGINHQAIYNHGSLEFRQLQCVSDGEVLVRWINIIMCLKHFVMNNTFDPVHMPQMVSQFGIIEFVENVFGEYAEELLSSIPPEARSRLLYAGLRAAQEVTLGYELCEMQYALREVRNPEPHPTFPQEVADRVLEYAKERHFLLHKFPENYEATIQLLKGE